MMKRAIGLLATALIAGAACAAPDVEALLQEADRARGADFPGLSWTITIDSHESDRDDHQVMTAQAQGNRTRVDFTAPEKIKGQSVLMLARNMWFSRPGLQKPVPISPRQRLLGQAANGDIASTNYAADYSARADGDERIDGEACAVLELASREKNTTYDRIRYWVSLSRKVGVKAEFYTVSGKHFKTATFEYENRIRHEGRSIPMVSRMTIVDALNPANVTTMRYSDIAVARISGSVFELNN
jgi:hypothetical protein